jgi:hypothetical protein
MASTLALAKLESALLDACSAEDEWPAQVAAAVYAGVDYAVSHPEAVELLVPDSDPAADPLRPYERLIGRLSGFLRVKAPIGGRLPVSTDEALVASVVGLVGDHLRIGRLDRLEQLRPDLVLLTLLPYLGFVEAQRWANRQPV